MPLRFDPREQTWREVPLAGPNPTQAPPVEPGFLWHLARISDRLGRPHRPYWLHKHGCWAIQALAENGEWRSVFSAHDDLSAHPGNERPYMPLDLRVIDEFANACMELKYNTGDLEKDRQLRDAEADARNAAETEREDQAGVERIAASLAKGIAGVEGDHKRAAKYLQHSGNDDGRGFREFFQVPAGPKA